MRGTLALLTALLLVPVLMAWQEPSQPEPLSPEQKELLKERDRFLAESRKSRANDELDQAVAPFEKALAIERKVFGETHETVVASLHALAHLHELREDFAAARKVREEVVTIQKKRFGDQHWRVTNAQFALAGTERAARMTGAERQELAEAAQLNKKAMDLRSSGQRAKAIEPAERSAAILKRVLGEKDPNYASVLNLLATLHLAPSDQDRAEALFKQAIDIRKQALGEQHPVYATSLEGLGGVYFRQKMYDKAEPLSRQALEIRKQAYDPNHPSISLNMSNLGLIHSRLKDFVKAESFFKQALEIRKQSLGEKHLDYAKCLKHLADNFAAQGQEAKAEPLARAATQITRQWYLQKRKDHYDKALALYRQGRYVEASRSIVSAESSDSDYWKAENLKGEGDEDLKTILTHRSIIATRARNLEGMIYQAQGNYSRAKFSYTWALGSFKRLVGEQDSDYARCLNSVAGMHLVQKDYDKAEPLFKQAQEIRKEALGTQHADYADSLISLSRFWGTLGDYARAEALCQQALKINEAALGEEDPQYVACLHQLARLYQVREDYVKADPLYRKVLAISKKALGEQHPDYAACLNDLAGTHQAQGDHEKAEALFKQALEITREWQLHEADILNKRIEAIEEQGDEWWAKFQRDYHKGVLREQHPHYVACLNNLARLYQGQGEYDKAELFFKKVVEIVQPPKSERESEISLRLHRQGISDYVQSLRNLAGLYLARGKNEPATSQPRLPVQSVELAQGDHEKARVLFLRVIGAQAQSQEWKKRVKVNLEGVKGFEQAAGFDKKSGFPTTVRVFNASDFRPLPGNVTLLADYGLLLEKRLPARPREDQLRGCDHAYALSLALLDRMRDEVLEHEASKLQHGAGLFDVIPRRLGICQRLFELEGKSGGNVEYLHKAFSTAELGRARVFLETLGRSRASLLGGVSPEMHAREVALVDKLRSYDAQIAEEWIKSSEKETKSTQEPVAVRKLRDEQGKSEKQLQELIGEMEKTYPQYAALKHPKPCTVDQARACLGNNEVALLFVLGKEASYLLLLESDATVKDPAKALAIYSLPRGEEIGDLVTVLTDLETLALPARARMLGRDGYEQLLRPVAERIKGKDLVIVPGEALCNLPFELLVENGKYLIENHRIRYAPSMTALHMMRLWQDKRAKQPDQGLWAMGDPVYDVRDMRLAGPGAMAPASQDAVKNHQISEGREGETAFPRLIHTAREVDDIRKLLNAPAEHVRTGERALESAVKAASVSGQLARHRYVHFATHGILGVAEGQPPALVLSLVGENGERDATGVNDGFLRLDEVTNLKLNADLVVLSACRTGQGKLLRGEGVSGLARAFLYAGSRGVVCSLWSVDDEQTASLMTDMYRRLKEGSTAASALHEAKLELIRADRAPIYWAPFILIGE